MEISNLDEFLRELDKAQAMVSKMADVVVRHIARLTYSYVIADAQQVGGRWGSPVWSGQFYSNHNLGVGSPDNSFTPALDRDSSRPIQVVGPITLESVSSKLQSIRAGIPVYITNAAPYAEGIESGIISQKTPQGVYRVAVETIKTILPWENWNAVFQKEGVNVYRVSSIF